MIRTWTTPGVVLLMLVLSSASARAQTADLLDLVTNVARSGHAAEALVANQAVIAVPLAVLPCPTVGVIYRSSGVRERGGPRIDNFQVCAEAAPQRLGEVSPALPDDQKMKEQTLNAMRTALRYGHQQLDWQGYRVIARRLSHDTRRGCAQIEVIVSSQGLLVAYQVGRFCT